MTNDKFDNIDFSTLPSQLKFVEEGKEISDPNKMRPDIMQFLMTAAMASHMGKIRKYFDDRTSEGWVENYQFVAGLVVTKITPSSPGQRLFIINDGVNPIFVEVNKRFATPTQLNATENITFDFETHKINDFWVYTIAGPSAVRALIRG